MIRLDNKRSYRLRNTCKLGRIFNVANEFGAWIIYLEPDETYLLNNFNYMSKATAALLVIVQDQNCWRDGDRFVETY